MGLGKPRNGSRSQQGPDGEGAVEDTDGRSGADPTGVNDLDQLLSSVAHGDESAFTRVYELTCRRVYGLVRKVVSDPHLSDDVTQDVYLQVWQQASRFDATRASGLAWLMTLTHRRAIDTIRAEQRHVDRQNRYGTEAQYLGHDDVAETVAAGMDAESVHGCLAMLTARQQESVRLAYYGGLTYQDVARKLEVPLPTVKSRIRDGLTRLRKCMETT